jgi:nicotinamidase-related amidase
MPVTTLDPKTALIVIDLQKGIRSYPTVHPMGAVVKQAATLAEEFRRNHLPVVLVNAAGRAPGTTREIIDLLNKCTV